MYFFNCQGILNFALPWLDNSYRSSHNNLIWNTRYPPTDPMGTHCTLVSDISRAVCPAVCLGQLVCDNLRIREFSFFDYLSIKINKKYHCLLIRKKEKNYGSSEPYEIRLRNSRLKYGFSLTSKLFNGRTCFN